MIGQIDIDAVAESCAVAADGASLGDIVDVYLDAASGEPTWAAVVCPRGRSIVPLTGAFLDDGEVVITATAGAVMRSPHVESVAEITPDEEAELSIHYGWERGPHVTSSGTGRAPFDCGRFAVSTEGKSA